MSYRTVTTVTTFVSESRVVSEPSSIAQHKPMGKIETSNERLKAFSDKEMVERVEWDDDRTAQVDDELAEYLAEKYSTISIVESDTEETEE